VNHRLVVDRQEVLVHHAGPLAGGVSPSLLPDDTMQADADAVTLVSATHLQHGRNRPYQDREIAEEGPVADVA